MPISTLQSLSSTEFAGIQAGTIQDENIALSGLLVCEDAQVLCTLNRALDRFKVETSLSLDAQDAEEQIASSHFDAVFVDFSNLETGVGIVKSLRKSKMNRDCTVLAMVDDTKGHHEAFKAGANFTIPRLHTVDQAMRCLRSSYFLMLRCKRASVRFAVDEAATMYRATEKRSIPAKINNLSETGLKLNSKTSLTEGELLEIDFQVPGGSSTISAKAKVVWTDASGNAGLQFTDVPEASLKSIQEWINIKLLGRLQ